MPKAKCSCKPPRREPMTVKVSGHVRRGGTSVRPHRRHKPK